MKSCIRAARSSFSFLIVVVAVFLVVVAVPVGAATWVSVAGVDCAAYNNSMADALERSHVRLFNPGTSGSGIWVVCNIPRTMENFTLSGMTPRGYVVGFFDASSAVGATILCGIREFGYMTDNVPGVTESPVNAVSVVITRPTTLPGANYETFSFITDRDGYTFDFFTITCNLPPGTGIQNIDLYQR